MDNKDDITERLNRLIEKQESMLAGKEEIKREILEKKDDEISKEIKKDITKRGDTPKEVKDDELILEKKDKDNKISKEEVKIEETKTEKNILDLIKVSEVIKNADVVDEKTEIEGILKKFLEKKYNEVFVSGKGNIIGLINLSNLLETLRKGGETTKLRATDLMEKVITINKEDSLSKAILIMNIHKLDCLGVTDGKEFLGIITQKRILNKIGKNLFSQKTGVEKERIETNVDKLLDILEKGKTSMKELERELDVGSEQIEEWLKILEKQKVIKIGKYFGKIKLEHVR